MEKGRGDNLNAKNKRILVAGLGLIGGSVAQALKNAGYCVFGWNRSPQAVSYALEHGIIDEFSSDFSSFDIIFVCLPPKACIDFLKVSAIKEGAFVFDICGVKSYIEDEVRKMGKSFRYVGLHPMAGKEISGIEEADCAIFSNASCVITSSPETDEEAYLTAKQLIKDMGFARVVECSAKTHDEKIAYTSQLAHIVSSCYVKNEEIDACYGFTGGSFQDMTRIAGVDEAVWSELYLLNSQNLIGDIDILIQNLSAIRETISSCDEAGLKSILNKGKEIFEKNLDKSNKTDITITYLK